MWADQCVPKTLQLKQLEYALADRQRYLRECKLPLHYEVAEKEIAEIRLEIEQVKLDLANVDTTEDSGLLLDQLTVLQKQLIRDENVDYNGVRDRINAIMTKLELMNIKVPSKVKHPIQPPEMIGSVLRFKQNKIVRYLLDNGGIDMNKLAILGFPKEDHIQFAQLIGYSLSGFSELSYVDDDTYGAAHNMAHQGMTEEQAKIQHLEEELHELREALVEPMARLFGKHPDDLRERNLDD